LEREYRINGKLPDIIYHQIDGGSENTAKVTLEICELLVAKRLAKKVSLLIFVAKHKKINKLL
jgi:hypothetical protein